jgi:hypothetical protein
LRGAFCACCTAFGGEATALPTFNYTHGLKPALHFSLFKNNQPMRGNPDYLSEFEQEFELEFESGTFDNEDDFELDNAYDSENDNDFEFESDNEYDSENDNDFEFEADSYESRLYEILNNNYESELEFENNLNEVLHEMEKDYFWGGLKKWVKKRGGISGLLAKYAKKLPIASAAQALSSVARGDLRGALKNVMSNDLLKTGLSFVPGGAAAVKGLDMANKLMGDSEAPNVPMEKVKQAVAVGKAAYDGLAKGLANAQTPQDVKDLGKKAFQQAIQDMKKGLGSGFGSGITNGSSRKKTVIPYTKGSKICIYPDRIVIIKPY